MLLYLIVCCGALGRADGLSPTGQDPGDIVRQAENLDVLAFQAHVDRLQRTQNLFALRGLSESEVTFRTMATRALVEGLDPDSAVAFCRELRRKGPRVWRPPV